MSAILKLDRFQLMWLCEGAMGKSHLRWDIYPMMVNDVWPQLSDGEREAIFTYVKRDESWKFNDNYDKTAKEYYLQMLARYNPANQYKVTLKNGRKKQVADNAYLWDGKYYVGWQRYCAPEHVIKVENKPYKKCNNDWCAAAQNDTCLRYRSYNHGDELLNDTACHKCECCDFVIAYDGMVDPVAKMVITPENNNK